VSAFVQRHQRSEVAFKACGRAARMHPLDDCRHSSCRPLCRSRHFMRPPGLVLPPFFSLFFLFFFLFFSFFLFSFFFFLFLFFSFFQAA